MRRKSSIRQLKPELMFRHVFLGGELMYQKFKVIKFEEHIFEKAIGKPTRSRPNLTAKTIKRLLS